MREPVPTFFESGKMIKSFDQWALRLTRPREIRLITSIGLGLLTTIVSFLISILVVYIESVFGYEESKYIVKRNIMVWSLGAVVLGPLIQTAIIVLIYNMSWSRLGLTGFVWINTLLFIAVHIPVNGMPVGAAILFFVMSYQYTGFREQIGPNRAFLDVAVSHATHNAIVVLIALIYA